jgi:LEA14-like dessication related protein
LPDTSLRRPGLLCLLLVLTLLPGCAALNVQPPTASFRSASVSDLSPAGVTANFDVDVQNPNSFDIPVDSADYKLSLSGVQVVDDQAKPTGSVPAKGRLPVTIPVHLRFEQLLQAEREIAKSGGTVPFDFDGALEFSTGTIFLGKSIKIPLHFSGTLPFRDAATRIIRDPATLADLLRDPLSRKFLESALGHKLIGAVLER